MIGKPRDQGKRQVLENQRESSSSRSMQVQRENMQPKKSARSMRSTETLKTSKKEPWNGMKAYHERKKREAPGSRDTIKDNMLHSTRYVVVVDARDWASVTGND